MANPKKYVENVVNEPKVSETPSVLVGPSEDKDYPGKLSPNPKGSGFTKQLFVDSLPVSGEPDVIYLVPKVVNGGVVGYKNWKWNPTTSQYERVYGSDPSLKLVDGGQGTLVNVVNPPREVNK